MRFGLRPRLVATAGSPTALGLLFLTLLLNLAAAAPADAPPSKPKPAAKVAPTNALDQANAPWKNLFDGKTLVGWKSTDFAGRGEVLVKDGTIVLETGFMTGITWTNEAALPRMNYEISLEAMRVDGSDFF